MFFVLTYSYSVEAYPALVSCNGKEFLQLAMARQVIRVDSVDLAIMKV